MTYVITELENVKDINIQYYLVMMPIIRYHRSLPPAFESRRGPI